MQRAFKGIELLYGEEGLKRIQNSHFLIIGIGGVGSWVAESLARTGAQKITLLDLDDICVSNINRQVHALSSNIGKFKIDEMKERILSINPDAEVECIHDFFTEKNLEDILSRNYTYIFDAIDSLASKCHLINECKKRELKLITIGAGGGKSDPTQIEIRDLNRTINDRLLFRVRKNLRQNFNYRRYYDKKYNIPAVFSTETAIEPKNFCESNGPKNCNTSFGSVSYVTGAMAFAAVSYVIRDLIRD